jgi:hypothetical protein
MGYSKISLSFRFSALLSLSLTRAARIFRVFYVF